MQTRALKSRVIKKKAKTFMVSGTKAQRLPANYIPRVIVKFHSDVNVPDDDAMFSKDLLDGRLGPWQRLAAADYRDIRIKRLITKLTPQKCRELVNKAKQVDPALHPPKFDTYFVIDQIPSHIDTNKIAKELDSWNSVEVAYVEGGPAQPPMVNRAANNPYGPTQAYLGQAPVGIDAEYAWSKGADGTGVNVKFADVEQGWNLGHEDLPEDIQLIHGENQESSHGTAVLGIVVAKDNTNGCVGITPYLGNKMVSSIWPHPPAAYPDPYTAILEAISNLGMGDVLLLEIQVNAQGYYPTRLGGQEGLAWYNNLPAEVEYPLFDLIRTATSVGIIVIEAAGNGGIDLDEFDPYAAPHWGKDSGAIIVAAADIPTTRSPSSYSRLGESNYGNRINCFAWGREICAPYDIRGPQKYVQDFGYTSGASAIIAGAALAVQCYAKATKNRTLSTQEMRRVLSDSAGTLSATSTVTDPNADGIGVMPNLRKILDSL